MSGYALTGATKTTGAPGSSYFQASQSKVSVLALNC